MGFAYSWLAVRGASASNTLRHLDLQPTDQEGTHPTWPLAGMQLDDDWYVVVAKDADFAAAQDLAGLSQFGEVICCAVEEHVMIATSASWHHGQQLWQIHHDSHQPAGHHHLTTSGTLPACYQRVCEEFVAQQTLCDDQQPEVDCILEVPLEVARQLTGFAIYEEPTADHPRSFVQLLPTAKWWQFWKR